MGASAVAATRRAWRIPRRPFSSMSWCAFFAALAVTVVGVGVAGAVQGMVGALSALCGGAVVMGLLYSGMVAVRWLISFRPGFLVLAGVYSFFLVHVLIMVAVAMGLREVVHLDHWSWALTAAAAVVAWQVGLVWGIGRSRVTVSSSTVRA